MRDSVKAYSEQKALIKKALKTVGFTDIEITEGYYYSSGFAKKNDKLIYFRIMNIKNDCSNELIMLRTAKHRKDFSMKNNNWVLLTDIETIGNSANKLVDV
ncbi:MAG: hypothetical protein U9O94_06185 [Nanoarchaeota archaeon]|nr:hypothetical protein [Nanoarchaeota archaeon]